MSEKITLTLTDMQVDVIASALMATLEQCPPKEKMDETDYALMLNMMDSLRAIAEVMPEESVAVLTLALLEFADKRKISVPDEIRKEIVSK